MKKIIENKKILKLVFLITIVTILILGMSFAFMNITLQGSKKHIIKAGSFELTLEEENGITLSDALPMYDEVGMLSEPFVFTLKNLGKMDLKYNIKLIDITTNANKIDLNNIRYGLKRDDLIFYGNVGLTNDGVIDSGVITTNKEIKFELRLWINHAVVNSEEIEGKTRSFKVNVESTKSDNDIILAATLDGKAINNFPTKEDNYGVESITCTDNLDASFDPVNWSVTVDGITKSNTTCIVNFSSSITLAETSEELTMSKSDLYAFYKNSFASTAISSDVLTGKTVYINGTETVGTMPDNGELTGTITTSGGTYTIPAGYTSGGTITGPTLESLVGNNVTLASNNNLLTGYTAYGVNGTKYTGNMTNNGAWSSSITTAGGSVTIPKGYHSGTGKVSASSNLVLSTPAVSLTGTWTFSSLFTTDFTKDITFSRAFAQTPTIVATAHKAEIIVTVSNKSTTGCTLTAHNTNTGQIQNDVVVTWYATAQSFK